MNPPRIFVATDLADPAAEAIRQADAHARSAESAFAVCHVLSGARVHMLFPQSYAREAVEAAALDERARGVVGENVSSTTGRRDGSFEVFVEHGTEYAEIVRRAEAWRATLIVVGGHARTGVARALLGSVAEKVVRYAHCPVLIARPAVRRGLVLCATDLSEPSLPAIAAAVGEARLRNAEILVLNVVDQGAPLATVRPFEGLTPLVLSPEMLHDIRQTACAGIERVLARLEARAEVSVVEGHAGSAILKCVEERQPELLVVGTRGRTGLARIVLGSVAEHVVRTAETSVLVVRLHP